MHLIFTGDGSPFSSGGSDHYVVIAIMDLPPKIDDPIWQQSEHAKSHGVTTY